MAITGKIKTVFSDEAKSEVVFPRTKTKAVSDDNNVGLDAILADMNHAIDTKVTASFVTNAIANAQLGGEDAEIDLSGYATKDELADKADKSHGTHVPTPQTANNAKFLRNDNTWQTVTPANIGAIGNSGHQILAEGDLKITDPNSQGYCYEVNRTVGSDTIIAEYSTAPEGALVRLTKNGEITNELRMKDSQTELMKPLTLGSGGTGANNAADARANLGALGNSGNQTLTSGGLIINDPTSQGYAFRTKRTVGSDIIESAFGSSPESAGVWAVKNGTTVNHLSLNSSGSYLQIPLGVHSGGTGANNAADARANLGAAPEGYGLGKYGNELPTATNANNCVKNGWYYVSSSTPNAPGGGSGVLRVDAHNESSILQTYYSDSATSAGSIVMQRMCNNGKWGSWCFVDPPMSIGEAYATTERYNGKIVYAKLVDFGALPNESSKTVTYCGSGSTGVVSLTGLISDGCCISAGYNRDMSRATSAGLYLDNTPYNIRIKTEYDISTYTALILVKYTID